MLMTYLAIGAGGAMGAISRFALARMLPSAALVHFPLQIFLVNAIGCLFLGILLELIVFYDFSSHNLRAFLITGFLGGFTTFSAFALDFGVLITKNLHFYAVIYALSSVIMCILCFFAGIKLIRFIVM